MVYAGAVRAPCAKQVLNRGRPALRPPLTDKFFRESTRSPFPPRESPHAPPGFPHLLKETGLKMPPAPAGTRQTEMTPRKMEEPRQTASSARGKVSQTDVPRTELPATATLPSSSIPVQTPPQPLRISNHQGSHSGSRRSNRFSLSLHTGVRLALNGTMHAYEHGKHRRSSVGHGLRRSGRYASYRIPACRRDLV